MPKHATPAAGQAVLLKWRFVPDKSGSAGVAKYWWSDGSKTGNKGLLSRGYRPTEKHSGQWRRGQRPLRRPAPARFTGQATPEHASKTRMC